MLVLGGIKTRLTSTLTERSERSSRRAVADEAEAPTQFSMSQPQCSRLRSPSVRHDIHQSKSIVTLVQRLFCYADSSIILTFLPSPLCSLAASVPRGATVEARSCGAEDVTLFADLLPAA